MAANKFATMIHRNTNKITLILIYAFLEWILILLLLFNSLFFNLIIKFADFFGLHPPCLWCNMKMHRDLLCEVHSREISNLGYCSNHHRLAESHDMCEHCLSSRPEFKGFSKICSFFPVIKGFGVIQNDKEKVGENGEVSLKCSCCGVRLDNDMYSYDSYILLKTSDILECAQKENWNIYDNHIQEGCDSDEKRSEFSAVLEDKNENQMLSEFDQLAENEMEEVLDFDINEEPNFAMLESMEVGGGENSLVFQAGDCNSAMEEFEQFMREMHLDVNTASEEHAQMDNNENEADVSIGIDMTNEIENQESVHSYECTHDDSSTTSINLDETDDHGPMQVKEQIVESQCLSVEDREDTSKNQPSLELEFNEIEEDKVPVTMESLRAALRAESKHLQALYAELEEERSASAVAADQAMAMINRLQEEKAAMQMEALQYERMMEEQCEYDQEALQMMNELVVKREKEKEELVKELELYRKRVLHYEIKEKIKQWESDGLSIDLNQETEEEIGNRDGPTDTIANLEDSLADFEEERLSILAELKVLEEKLIMLLDDDYKEQFEGVKAMGDFHEENGLNAICYENGDLMLNGNENGFDLNGMNEMESKKVGIEEELDHLYERLEALEADKEFIKQCFRSLKKGDKGVELLEDILQHLRDLRNIELHVRNLRNICSSTSESTVRS